MALLRTRERECRHRARQRRRRVGRIDGKRVAATIDADEKVGGIKPTAEDAGKLSHRHQRLKGV
jgi:hypothetical protein